MKKKDKGQETKERRRRRRRRAGDRIGRVKLELVTGIQGVTF